MEKVYPGGYVRTAWKLLARMRMENPSISLADASAALGVNHQTVRLWLRKDEYQRYENWMISEEFNALPPEQKSRIADVRERIGYYADEMEERLRDIIETTPDQQLQAKLCQDYLDRAGYGAVKRIEQTSKTFTLSAEALLIMDQRAREAGLKPLLPEPQQEQVA